MFYLIGITFSTWSSPWMLPDMLRKFWGRVSYDFVQVNNLMEAQVSWQPTKPQLWRPSWHPPPYLEPLNSQMALCSCPSFEHVSPKLSGPQFSQLLTGNCQARWAKIFSHSIASCHFPSKGLYKGSHESSVDWHVWNETGQGLEKNCVRNNSTLASRGWLNRIFLFSSLTSMTASNTCFVKENTWKLNLFSVLLQAVLFILGYCSTLPRINFNPI